MIKKPYQMVIAEDDTDIAHVLLDQIDSAFPGCFKIDLFEDAKSALKFIKVNRVDIVCTDLKMPGQFGDSFLYEVREHDPSILRVIITGYPSFPIMASAHRDGVHSFILKPFDEYDLKESLTPIVSILENWEHTLHKYFEAKD